MKTKIKILFIALVAVMFFAACEEDMKGPIYSDSISPSPLSSPQVENLPGAAQISYILPGDEDLLYVRGEYERNGIMVDVKSSVFNDRVLVEGFGDTDERKVKLYAVDKAENVSTGIDVTINPTEPNVNIVAQTINLRPDFGGVIYEWTNPNKAPLMHYILAPDSTGKIINFTTLLSDQDSTVIIRGFEDTEMKFGMVLRDRWNNFSDTVYAMITPRQELLLDKNKFNQIVLDDDTDLNAWEGRYERLYDDNITTFSHSLLGAPWPNKFTLDLGVSTYLSRVIVHQRQQFPFAHANPKEFEIWGTNEAPSQDGDMSGWFKLRDCYSTRPSKNGGTVSDDEEQMRNGEEFGFSLDQPVRYVRFIIKTSWGGARIHHIAELTFYGQIVD